VSPEVHRKVSAHAGSRRPTESGVVESPLAEYVGGSEVDRALVVRRPDAIGRTEINRDRGIVQPLRG
jgi:hypothetical protein